MERIPLTCLPPMHFVNYANDRLIEAKTLEMEKVHYKNSALLCGAITILGLATLFANQKSLINLNPFANKLCKGTTAAEALVGIYYVAKQFSCGRESKANYASIDIAYDNAREYIEKEAAVLAKIPEAKSAYERDYSDIKGFSKEDYKQKLIAEAVAIRDSKDLYQGAKRIKLLNTTYASKELQEACQDYIRRLEDNSK